MKLKKILAMTMMVSLLSTFTGCSSSGTDSDKVTIDVFNIKVETKEQLEDLAKEYEKENEGVKINITTVGGGQDSTAALQAKFSSGDEPAIFLLGGLSGAEKWQDKLLNLKDTELAKNAIEGTLDGITLEDGNVYGVPMNIEGFSLLINKELFEKAGVDLKSINSFETFEAAVEKVDSKKEELGLKAVFGFSAKESWVVGQYSSHFMSPEFNNNPTDIYKADEIEYKYGEDFKKYTDLINKYNVQPILSLDYSTAVEEYFVNDQVAVIHQGNWIKPTLDSLDPEFCEEKLGILPMFVGEEQRVAVGVPWYWGVNKTKDESVVQASLDFLNWMYTDEDAKQALVEDFGYIPAYTNFDSSDLVDPLSSEIFTYLNEGNIVTWAHNYYPDGYMETRLYPEFQKYLNGDITWEEFEANTAKSWKEMK